VSLRSSLRIAAAVLVVAVVASCTAGLATGAAPSGYPDTLWAQRPVVRLAFDVADDLRSVTGRESVQFTPDAPVCEMVFRAHPNDPTLASSGSSLTLTSAAVDDQPVVVQTEPAGAPAGAPGTLLQLPLPRCLQAGDSVRADLAFTVGLGRDADERIGSSPDTDTAWLGSAFPLLSWVRGGGWTRDPAVGMNGETAVSEEFRLAELTVTAPAAHEVVGVGVASPSSPGPRPDTTTHRFSADAVRDVSVSVGRYDIRERDVNGVRVHLATPSAGTRAAPSLWADQLATAVDTLGRHFGPFPYADLWVSIAPGLSDGVEFPGALQLGDVTKDDLQALVAHEVAHQWFYSLVGDNQAEHPWLDESLATVGEALAGGDADYYRNYRVPDDVAGHMGEPMSYWASHGGFRRYGEGVYNQGASVLLRARDQVGPDPFDAALRGYIGTNAHRVATPADFARAFADHPEVLDALRQAGALADTE
jgi:peptidase M1-like protein